MDGGDCITSRANAVGENRRLYAIPMSCSSSKVYRTCTIDSLQLKFHGSSFLVASSSHPREDVARVGHVGEDVTVTSICYEETAPVEFQPTSELIRVNCRSLTL